MSMEKYKPSQEEISKAEEMMTDEQKTMSEEREASFLSPESKSFDSKNNTLLLRISKDSVDLSGIKETAEQKGYDEKSELHITVLGFKNGAEIKKILKKLSPEEQQAKLSEIQALVDSTDWSFVPEEGKYHISKEYKTPDPKNKGAELSETRESFIQRIHMQAMQDFYEKLNGILGSNLEAPPAHVTLYTNGTDKEKAKMGIGINSEAELAQLNPELISESSKETSVETEKAWNVEILEQVKDIKPSQFHPEKKWMATHFMIEKPDGTTEEVESTKIILKVKNKNGVDIEVPAFAVHHIMSLHLKGEEAGGVIEGGLESSFGVVAEHLPSEIPFKGNSAAFEVDAKQNTGTEGVSSQREMMEKGIATKEDLDILATAKDEVFRLNIEGTDEEKKKFVDEFNVKVSGNVRLGVRGGAVTPFFTAERQPTSKMFLVVGKEKDPDNSEHNRVWTMTPGRYMDKLPTDGQFVGRFASEGVPEGVTVADLWKKARTGEKLSPEEVALIDSQRKAQECWWNGGFIVAPEKK